MELESHRRKPPLVRSGPQVAMTIHFPVSAKSFVLPQVKHLMAAGVPTELWVEDLPNYREFTKALDCPVRIICCNLTLNPLKAWKRFRELCHSIRDSGIEAIHCHQTRASILPLLAAKWQGVPTRVYQNHGLPYLGYRGLRRFVLRLFERINIWAATEVLLVSHSNLEAARADGLLGPTQGTVLHFGSAMGINVSRFDNHNDPDLIAAARESFGLRTGKIVFGYVGRPVSRKGFHLTLKAWARSGLGSVGHQLLIAGCTPDECAAAGGQVEGVVSLGYINNMDRFYAACDVVVLPSDHEGFPTALLEASAAGRATIGADVPGTRCAVLHEQTGLLVPPKDSERLCEAMQLLVEVPQLRNALAKAGKHRIEKYFRSDDVLDALLDYYKTKLGLEIPAAVLPEHTSRKAA